jgi:DNA-binding beta-propeller fold protein YncE
MTISLRACIGLLLALGLLAGARAAAAGRIAFQYAVRGFAGNESFREPAALALDVKKNLLYVADREAGAVFAFSLQGIPRFRLGAKDGVTAPIGVAVDRRSTLFVSEDAGGPVQVRPLNGDPTTLELPPAGEKGNAPKPGRLATDRDDNLYVVDRANGRVCVFDKAQKFKFSVGSLGDREGQFKTLQDIAIDRAGRLFALDATGPAVQVFDRAGKYLYTFGTHGEADTELAFPVALFVDRQDQVWVVDRPQHAVKVFDRMGTFLLRSGIYGQAEGQLFHPIDAVLDDAGHLFTLEVGTHRLQVFVISRPFEPFSATL